MLCQNLEFYNTAFHRFFLQMHTSGPASLSLSWERQIGAFRFLLLALFLLDALSLTAQELWLTQDGPTT